MEDVADGRRARGDRTRRAVAAKAAELASVDGLSGMTLGQIAQSLEMSKSSVQVAFANKSELQLATIAAASQIFVDAVVIPSLSQPKGLPRLTALIDNWVDYISGRVLPGGCFMAATFAEFDSKPGQVRDALAETRNQWLEVIERQVAFAQANGEVPSEPRPTLVAFEIDALLASANVVRNLYDDETALTTASELIHLRLGSGE